VYFSNPREGGYIELAIHGPLWAVQGHMGHSHIYTNTPCSLDYRRNGVQDWPTKKESYTQGPPQPQLVTGYVEAGPELRRRSRKEDPW
jgi:hypothetical protein